MTHEHDVDGPISLDEMYERENLWFDLGDAGFFMIGRKTFPNCASAASDSQTSTTDEPFGRGPAMCASTPSTGESATLLPGPFHTSSKYLVCSVSRGKIRNDSDRDRVAPLMPLFSRHFPATPDPFIGRSLAVIAAAWQARSNGVGLQYVA